MRSPYLNVLILMVALALPILAGASTTAVPPTVELPSAIHFTGSDGQDMVVGPGSYRVEAQESQLRLTPAEGKDALVVTALPAQHEESVEAPVAMLVVEDGQEDQIHVVLMLPEHKGWDAVGTVSGIAARATRATSLSRIQVQSAYKQQVQSIESPKRLQPIKVAPSVVPPPAATTAAEIIDTVQLGRQVTWSFLAMRHPDMVAGVLAAVQTGKQPRESLAGLVFSDTELNETMKTDWSVEVTRLNAMNPASVTQPTVTPRGLSLADQAKRAPSATAAPPLSANAIAPMPVRIPIAIRDLGSVWAGQQATTVISLLAPADGYIQATLDTDATNRHFRILHARSYTGEVVNGALVIAQLIPGGQYQEFIPDPANPKGQISKAGFVTILTKKGQQIDFTIAFDPVGLGMTPVGNNEATLELSEPMSPEVNILSPSAPPAMWTRTAILRARFEGINFGVIGQLDNASIKKFVSGYVPGSREPLQAALILTNPEQRTWTVTISPVAFDPRLHMASFSVSLGPGERKLIPLPLQIDAEAYSISERRGAIRYAYGNVVRQVGFGVTYYWSHHAWHSRPDLQVGYCKCTWDLYIQPDGTTTVNWTVRNTHLLVEMRIGVHFDLLGYKFSGGGRQIGQKSITPVTVHFAHQSKFVADNYVRLLGSPVRVKIDCNES